MLASSSKRHAARSPDARPYKRQEISSPEEGELDDTTPPRPTAAGPSTSPSASAKVTKIPFPFKTKPSVPEVRPEYPPEGRGPPTYSRFEDERRYREDDPRRNGAPRPVRGGDHWVSNYPDGRPPRPRWEAQEVPYYPRAADRWEPRGERPAPLVSPRLSRRSRSVSSPRSPRSPRSPESTGKEKHRLPRPSYPQQDVRGNFEYDRDWERRGWEERSRYGERRRGSPPPAWEEDESRHYPRRHESRDSRQPYDDRPREPHERKGTDAYHPLSPHTPVRPPSPESLRDARSGPVSPPLPTEAPPPAPPPDERSDVLPMQHPTVKIALPKKPASPSGKSPMSLLAVKEPSKPQPLEKKPKTEERQSSQPEVVYRAIREPVQRTREEEKAAYGRIFQGCGMQSDYDVITKLGEGTFGEVHKAVHREMGNAVALKRILMHNEKEGMPVTALREIKILKALHHENIVEILDMFVVRSRGKESPLSVYMVFPYMDHDLAGLLENERVKLSPSQIKLYMKQLLEGTEYMHRNHILHRDMKAANLLISNSGCLKIADFGLARAFDPNVARGDVMHGGKERKYTNCVVTRWYRPPELLLGARQYGGEVDMWGIGCVLGEMFWRKPILPGSSDLDQLDKIWQLCGTPTQITWPNFDTLPGCEGVKRFNMYTRRLKQTYETIGTETCDLLDKLLVCNPRERITATQALDHDYFWTHPLPADPKTLPSYEASHEFDKRGRRNQAPVGPPLAPRPDAPSRPLPVPTQPPLHFSTRPPPPRDAYRGGSHPHFHGQIPGNSYSSYAPAPRFGQAPIAPPPMTLPPIVLRPGQPPPVIWPGAQMDRPAHLPPRPMESVGGGRRYPRHEPAGSGELNYG